MNILLLGASPRKGSNSEFLLERVHDGFIKNVDGSDITHLNVNNLNINPCSHCDICQRKLGCVHTDDTNSTLALMEAADIIIFALPVYWWGIPSQLKLVIDKLYSKIVGFKELRKKVGVIVVGGASLDNPQYKLIDGQFTCILEYLNWDYTAKLDSSAHDPGDTTSSTAESLLALDLWKKFV